MVPLNVKTHYSLSHSPTKPEALVKKCVELGFKSCALTDINNISGAVDFAKHCSKYQIKPIFGVELSGNINEILLAKNINGWRALIKIVSKQYKNALTRDDLDKYKADLITLPSTTPAAYYINPEDSEDQKILLCSYMKTTLNKVNNTLSSYPHLYKFFSKNDFSLTRMKDCVDNSDKIADQCENYTILSKPKLPKFDCPDGMTEDDYLVNLCMSKLPNDPIYIDRMNMEMAVFRKAGLSGYFLIVQDYVNWAKRKGWLVGSGRGSVGGCLIAYLCGITTIDPIQYNLLLSRFYNDGRNTEDRVSLPDIDVDFPAAHRDEVFVYIKEKYGQDYAAQICTFLGSQGRAAIKEVLRILDGCDVNTMNRITKFIPEKGKISDKLEESQETSILKWMLEYEPNIVKDYCTMDDTGNLHGDYAKYFEQAIRIEGIYKSIGKHAAGIVISKDPITDICPMMEDRIAMEMNSIESLGLAKMDVLSLSSLDRLQLVNKLLRYGKI